MIWRLLCAVLGHRYPGRCSDPNYHLCRRCGKNAIELT